MNNYNNYQFNNLEEWYLGNNQQMADTLFNLVLQGKKKATSYLFDGTLDTNTLSVLTNWDKTKKLLIRTTKIKVVEFNKVTKAHAKKEGEGDKTLDYWIKVHTDFFSKELKLKHKKLTPTTLIICEEFEVVKQIQ